VVVCGGVLSKTLREAGVSVLEDDHVADAAGAGGEAKANLLPTLRRPAAGAPAEDPSMRDRPVVGEVTELKERVELKPARLGGGQICRELRTDLSTVYASPLRTSSRRRRSPLSG